MEMLKENPTKGRRLATQTKKNTEKNVEKMTKNLGLFSVHPYEGGLSSSGVIEIASLYDRLNSLSNQAKTYLNISATPDIGDIPKTWIEEFYSGKVVAVKYNYLVDFTILSFFHKGQLDMIFSQIKTLSGVYKEDLKSFIESFELFFAKAFLKQLYLFNSDNNWKKIFADSSKDERILYEASLVEVDTETFLTLTSQREGVSYEHLKNVFIIEFNKFFNKLINDRVYFKNLNHHYEYKNAFLFLKDCFDGCLLTKEFYKLINGETTIRKLKMYENKNFSTFFADTLHFTEQLAYNPYLKKEYLPKNEFSLISRLEFAEALYRRDQVVSYFNHLKKKVKETEGKAGHEIWLGRYNDLAYRVPEWAEESVEILFNETYNKIFKEASSSNSVFSETMSGLVDDFISIVDRYFKLLDVGVTKSSIEWGERALTFKPKSKDDIEYFWEYIDMPYVPKEGTAMGHCGNQPRQLKKDKIFSLRSYNPKSKTYGVHVTLTMNQFGIVYEIKGRGNNYPAPEYQPMIAELIIKDDRIKVATAKLGHKPSADFDILKYYAEVDNTIKLPTKKLDLTRYVVDTLNSNPDFPIKIRYSEFTKEQIIELIRDDSISGDTTLVQQMKVSGLFTDKELRKMIDAYISDLVVHGGISQISKDKYEVKGLFSGINMKFFANEFEEAMVHLEALRKNKEAGVSHGQISEHLNELGREMNRSISHSYQSIMLHENTYGNLFFKSVNEMMEQSIKRMLEAIAPVRFAKEQPRLTDQFSLTQSEEVQMVIELSKSHESEEEFLFEEFDHGYNQDQMDKLKNIVVSYLEYLYKEKQISINVKMMTGKELLKGVRYSLMAYDNFIVHSGGKEAKYIFPIVSNIFKLDISSPHEDSDFTIDDISISDFIDVHHRRNAVDRNNRMKLYKDMESICNQIVENHCEKIFIITDYTSFFEMVASESKGFLANNYTFSDIHVGNHKYHQHIKMDDSEFLEYLKNGHNFEQRIYQWLSNKPDSNLQFREEFSAQFDRACYRIHEQQASERMRSDFEEKVQDIVDIDRVDMNDTHHFEVKLRGSFLNYNDSDPYAYEWLRTNYNEFLSAFSSIESLAEFVGNFYNDHLRSDQDYEFEYLDTDNVDWNEFYEQFAQEIWEDYIHEIEEFEKAKDSSDESDTEK